MYGMASPARREHHMVRVRIASGDNTAQQAPPAFPPSPVRDDHLVALSHRPTFFFFCSWASFIPHYSSTFSTNLMPCNDCQYLASPHSLDPAIPGCIIFSQLWAKCTLVIVGLPECPMLNKKPTCSSVYTHICFCRLARPIVRESIPVTRVAIVRPIRSALRIRRRSRLFPPISAWTTSTTLCCILSPLSKSCSRLFLGSPP